MRVEINVLGGLQATAAGKSFVPTASKVRQVLALLAMRAGKVVSVSDMMEEIWGDALPRSVSTTLHTYISHLRRRLEMALLDQPCSAKEILVTEHKGYLLDIDQDGVDAYRYDELSTQGRRAAEAGDYVTAARILRAANDVWRGPALADVTVGSQLEIEVLRYEESRLNDLELRIEAELRLRRHHLLLDELAVVCAQHPMLENFHAQYMLALYRSNRQSRALGVYRQLHSTIKNEIGLDPAPRLRQLHQAILVGDPALDDPDFTGSGWRSAAGVG